MTEIQKDRMAESPMKEEQKSRKTEFCKSESNGQACLDTAERKQNGQSQIQKGESPLLIKSAAFADRILDMCDYLLGENDSNTERQNNRKAEQQKGNTAQPSEFLDFCNSAFLRKRVPYSLKVCVEQVTRSGTSIGANVAEGTEAQSKADLTSKNGIALKEAQETQFWLGRLLKRGYISEEQYASMMSDLTELLKMLGSSIRTLKK